MKKFKLVTLLGIRPDVIRMFKLIKLLDQYQKKYGYEHIYAHTGQHFDYELDTVFYEQLGVRKPDINLQIGKTLKERAGATTFVQQMGLLFERVAEFIEKHRPDAIMYLGDTNSVVSSQIVARYNVPVIHIEGGGRSFDWRMPEEKCRIIIDHMSDMIYSYLPHYRENLLREGIPGFRIQVIGNIIDDAVKQFLPIAEKTPILKKLGVKSGTYTLVTIHREENTSVESVLRPKIMDLIKLSKEMPIIYPIMPRVRKLLSEFGLQEKLDKSSVIQAKPFGFLEFLNLEKHAKVVVSDSGTVQEETLILGTPCHITRRSTERPETIEAGATILADDHLYENTHRALKLDKNWDKTILNPFSTSPSEVVFQDLVKKIQNNFFNRSRSFEYVGRDMVVQQAYGKHLE